MSKLQTQFFRTVAAEHARAERAYRELIVGSNEALRLAKRAIFAFHRADMKEGDRMLAEAAGRLRSFEAVFRKQPLLRGEGVYRAGLEEFVEASVFAQFLAGESIGAVTGFKTIDAEVFVGGLSDLTGELVRYAIARATDGDAKEVRRAHATLTEVMEFLIAMDLTGQLRTKFDQAKNSMRKMEDILYDLSVKK